MKIISIFNNKGGVGKSTLAYHLSHILAEMGHKTLVIDLDPQCNLTIYGMEEETLHKIWADEDDFIEDYGASKDKMSSQEFKSFIQTHRTIHFLLKPTEDGISEISNLPPPVNLRSNLDLIPGRLTIHKYENKISERWSGAYLGESLSIRTITNIRTIAEEYAKAHNYEFVLIDTSPSLGSLNKVIISTVDGFLIPALPDMFSLYGIRNIGSALMQWQKEFNTIFSLISSDKRNRFPQNFVRFLGYTIYNAKRYTGTSEWNLAKAHLHYAQQIPHTIETFIDKSLRAHLSAEMVSAPVGGTAVMHTHNTLPNMAQKYKHPIWEIPDLKNIEKEDFPTINVNANTQYRPSKQKYMAFAQDFLKRIATL